MSASPAVQAAKKKMQLARLKEKEDNLEGYPEFYANQPAQLERARLSQIFKDSKASLRAANEVLEIAIIDGEGLEVAREAQAIAAKVAEMSQPPRRGATGAGLGAAGGL
ncbi:hypothetical protein LCGC14_1549830 [marine sediment metagenome]|uniref:Uncharacterized protein n=1 Tax=marine sediment metagenome TaxID=412755 RepID=A0A0F9JBM7_9ZZZZ